MRARPSPSAPAGLAPAAGVAVGTAGVLVLAVMLNTAWLAGLDVAAEAWFADHRSRAGEAEGGSVFGYIGRPVHVLTAALAVGALLSARARSLLPMVLVTGAVGTGVIVEHTLKAIVGRTPEVLARLQEASAAPVPYYQHSFPSGHVTGTAALLGTVAVLAAAGRGRTARTILALSVGAAVGAVALLALYTGAHTLTDVIGGACLGSAVVGGAAALRRAAVPSSRAAPRRAA